MPDRSADELDLPWTELAAAVLPLAALSYALPASVAWLHDGTGALPPLEAILGTLRIAADGHIADPALAYPTELRAHMPAGGSWWIAATWLVVTLVAAGLAAWRRLEPLAARSVLGRRPYDPRGARPRAWARGRDLDRDHRRRSRQNPGFSLGRLDRRRVTSDAEAHVALVAPTRAGKTTRCVIPWLLEHEGPAIVTSTKPDVLRATRDHRAELGEILVFDPFGAECARWTPLDDCTDWSRALRQAQWFADCVQAGESAEARFWNGEAAKLLAPLLHATALDARDVADVLAWVDTQDAETPGAILERHHAGPARRQLDAITALDPRNAGNTYLSAGALLHAYRYPEVHRTDGPRLTARGFLDGAPHTLYVIAPDRDQRLLAPLVVALLSSILHRAADIAGTRGPIAPPLRVLLDEAANIAPLRDLPRYLSQSSAHGVRIATVWQSIAQLRAAFHDAADDVLANSTAKLFMGPITDEATRNYVTSLLGDEQATGHQTTLDPDARRATRNVTERTRDKASASELQQLRMGRALLVQGVAPPAVVSLARPGRVASAT